MCELTEVANEGSLDGTRCPLSVDDAVVVFRLQPEDLGPLKWSAGAEKGAGDGPGYSAELL